MIAPSPRTLAVSVALATGWTVAVSEKRPSAKTLLGAQRDGVDAFSFMGDAGSPAAGAIPQG